VDREHHERTPHGNERSQARVAALEFLHHEPVADVVHPRAAVAGQVRPEEAQLADLRREIHRERAVLADVLLQPRQEFPADEFPDGGAHESLFVRQQLVYSQKVDAVEFDHGKAPL